MHVYRANIKSALKSTSRERQYVSRPGMVGHEILEQSASTERLKFIVHGVAIAVSLLCDSRFYVIMGARKMETACQIRAFPLHFARLNLTSVPSKVCPWYLNIFHARASVARVALWKRHGSFNRSGSMFVYFYWSSFTRKNVIYDFQLICPDGFIWRICEAERWTNMLTNLSLRLKKKKYKKTFNEKISRCK